MAKQGRITGKERQILVRVEAACRKMGGQLDYTATTPKKLVDRQRAHMLVARAIFGALMQHPDNEEAESDWEDSEAAIVELEALVTKQYT